MTSGVANRGMISGALLMRPSYSRTAAAESSCLAGSLGKRILEDLSVLHDHDKIPGRIRNQVDVLHGIALDQQEIGQGPFLDDAQLARIGTAQSREREQLSVVAGRHLERLARR